MNSRVTAATLIVGITMSSFSIAEETTDPILGQWAHGEGRINEEGIDGMVLEFDHQGEFKLTSPEFHDLAGTWQPNENPQVYEIPMPLLSLPPLQEVFSRYHLPEIHFFGKPYLLAWWKSQSSDHEDNWRLDLVVAKKKLIACEKLDIDWPWADSVAWNPKDDDLPIIDDLALKRILDPPFQAYCIHFSEESLSGMTYGRAQAKAFLASEQLHFRQDFTPEERMRLDANSTHSDVPNLSFHISEGFWKWTEKDHQE